jgi:hypothetical protein
MFAKKEWFQKRKYGGWGLSPKTWQGWVYILGFVLVLAGFNLLPFWDNSVRIGFLMVWALLLGFDVVRIMFTLEKDELEKKQEALAERNASWTMVFILTIGILYQVIRGAMEENFEVNIFLIVALVGGVIVKTVSYIYLEKQ